MFREGENFYLQDSGADLDYNTSLETATNQRARGSRSPTTSARCGGKDQGHQVISTSLNVNEVPTPRPDRGGPAADISNVGGKSNAFSCTIYAPCSCPKREIQTRREPLHLMKQIAVKSRH